MSAPVPNGRPREALLAYDPPLELGPCDPSAGAVTSIKAQLAQAVTTPQVNAKPSNDDIINSCLPPREWIEDNTHYVQYVNNQAATRLDVIQLQEALDQRLMERQARESGICPVREELYSQCFDELIRQVTLNSPERGMLLLRVRDEIRMTIAAYNTLFQSSVTFGTRKQLDAERGVADKVNAINELQEQKSKLEARVVELKNKVETIERREAEKRAIAEKKRKEDIDFLKHQQQHLESFLKTVDQGK